MTVYNEIIMNIWEVHVQIVPLIAVLQVNKQLFLLSYSWIVCGVSWSWIPIWAFRIEPKRDLVKHLLSHVYVLIVSFSLYCRFLFMSAWILIRNMLVVSHSFPRNPAHWRWFTSLIAFVLHWCTKPFVAVWCLTQIHVHI